MYNATWRREIEAFIWSSNIWLPFDTLWPHCIKHSYMHTYMEATHSQKRELTPPLCPWLFATEHLMANGPIFLASIW